MSSVALHLHSERETPEVVDQATRRLLAEINASGRGTARLGDTMLPEASKAGTSVQVGELIVTGTLPGSTVTWLAGLIETYLGQVEGRSVTCRRDELAITVTQNSTERELDSLRALMAGDGGPDTGDVAAAR
jgi:hypothetical protein